MTDGMTNGGGMKKKLCIYSIERSKKNDMVQEIEGYHSYYVYILTNKHRTTLYIGVTNNLKVRLSQHKTGIELNSPTFTAKYKLEYLVYYEKHTWIQLAIAREKELKGWRRQKKMDLIREFNPAFAFLNHYFV